ncbi:MAG: hypothetical protein V4592_01960 [Bacteroidota bacterium]
MTEKDFEEENEKFRKKINSIDKEISDLRELIKYNPYLTNYSEQARMDLAKRNVEYKLLVLNETKKQIEDKLQQSFAKRRIDDKISNYLSYLPELPDAPKKVRSGGLITKPVYSFSNGCLLWMIAFVVIGLILILLFFK